MMSMSLRMPGNGLRWNILLLMLPLVSACTLVKPLPPEVSLQSLEVTGFSLSHATLSADLQIFNPNRVSVTLKEVDYVLRLNDVVVSKGQSNKKVRIRAGEYGIATLRLSSAYSDLFRVLKQARKEENVAFDLKGRVKVGGFGVLNKSFRFDKEGLITLKELKPK